MIDYRALATAAGYSVRARSSHGPGQAWDWGPKHPMLASHFDSEEAAWRDLARWMETRLDESRKLVALANTSVVNAAVPAGAINAALLGEVMQDAWGEICDDSGAHPLDMKHGRGSVLFYSPGHWTDLIVLRLNERVTATAPKVAVPAGEWQSMDSAPRDGSIIEVRSCLPMNAAIFRAAYVRPRGLVAKLWVPVKGQQVGALPWKDAELNAWRTPAVFLATPKPPVDEAREATKVASDTGAGLREAFEAGFEAGSDAESYHSRGLSTDANIPPLDVDSAWRKFTTVGEQS